MRTELAILGPMQATVDGGAVALGPPRQRALLAYLVVHAGRSVRLDELVEELWGDRRAADPTHNVQVYVSNLRKVLEPSRRAGEPPALLTRTSTGYRLDVADCRIDAVEFERLVRSAAVLADPAKRRQLLDEALGLWRGPALVDVAETFAAREAHRLEQLRLDAVEARTAAALELGAGRELVGDLDVLVTEQPLRERFWAQLALALYRSGRQADALRRLTQLRELLAELGLATSPEVDALEHAILVHAPGLVAAVPALTAPTEQPVPASVPSVPSVTPPRLVTVLAGQLVEPAPWRDGLDPEELELLRAELVGRATAIVTRFGTVAEVEAAEPDRWTATWAGREDDPERAVRAALEIVDLPQQHREELALGWNMPAPSFRLGVATGSPEAAAADAERLRTLGPLGTVLVGVSTAERVHGLFHWAPDVSPAPPAPAIQTIGGATPGGGGDGHAPPARIAAAAVPGARRRHGPATGAPLVGREPERAKVAGALAALRGGRGGFVLITGDAGLGKTRLLDEVHGAFVEDDAGLWLGGSGRSGGGPVAYHPVREALLGWLGLGPDTPHLRVRVALARAGRQVLGTAWPAAARPLGAVLGLAEPDDAEFASHREGPSGFGHDVAATVSELLAALARTRPVVVAVDDLHWADASSLDLLERVASVTEHAAVLFVFTLRPDRTAPAWALAEGVRGRYGHRATDVELEPLPAADLARLLDHLVGHSTLPADVHAELRSTSAGNPLFLEELVRSLEARGALLRTGSGDRLVGPVRLELTPTIEQVIGSRLVGFDPTTSDVLDGAAVIGPRAGRRMLSEVAGHPSGLDRSIAELCRRQLLVEVERWPEPVYEFAHTLVHQAVLTLVPPARCTELHRRAAAALESGAAAGDVHGVAAAIAAHHDAAGRPDLAVTWYERGVAEAEGDYAYPEAEALAAAGVEAADRCVEPVDPSRLVKLLLTHARIAHWRTTDSELVWPALQRALDLLRVVDGPELRDQAMDLAATVDMISDLDLARQHLRADLTGDRRERGRLEVTRLARLALVEANRLDLSAAQHAATEAVTSSAPDGDPTCRIRALDGAKLVAAYQGDHAEQRRLITEILARRDPTAGGVYHLHAVAELAMAELSCGNWDRAVDQIDEALGRAAKAHVHGLSVALMSGWKIQAIIGAGRLGHALEEAEQLMATYTDLGAPRIALGAAQLARGRARAEAGAFATALADLDGAAELAGAAGFRSLALPAACRAAAVAAELGDVGAARLRRADALVTSAPRFRFEADSWVDLAEAHLAAEEPARAAALLAEVEAGMPSTAGSGDGRPPAWVLTRAAMLSSLAASSRPGRRGPAEGRAVDPRCQPHAGHRWRAWAARAGLTGRAADRAQAQAQIEQLAASLSAADQPGFLLAALSRLSR